MGLPAGQSERDQADRSDSRAGLSGLGRQRPLRRRQRDQQVAARDAGDQRDVRHRVRSRGANGEDSAPLWYVSGTHAQAINDRWAFKLSAGAYSQDPLSRPTGTIPCDRPEVCTVATTTYPAYTNTGTTQPKFDARVDYDYPDGAKLSFTGGVAGTDGMMHSGIGPFDIQSGTVMGYGKANYTKKALRASFFTNILHGDADNLLARIR